MSITGWLFPGQASQYVGMGKSLEKQSKYFDKANDILGYDLREMCFEGPLEKITLAVHIQPAIFTVSCMAAAELESMGVKPDYVAGHSVGEYGALVSAGVFDFETGLKIIDRRAKLMNEATEACDGVMAAVLGMSGEAIEEVLAGRNGLVGMAGFNSPKQQVISGDKNAVLEVVEELKGKGARRAVVLPVGGPCHSKLMESARVGFKEFLADQNFNEPAVPYVSNLDGTIKSDPDDIRDSLSQLLISPVRWISCLETMAENNVEKFLEVGPGKVLSGLVKQTLSDIPCTPVESPESMKEIN